MILAAVALATLWPASLTTPRPGVDLCVLCGDFGLADAIANVVLFVPLGLAFAQLRRSWWASLALLAGLSATIELLQLAIPGRTTSLSDLTWNTVGAAIGIALARGAVLWMQPSKPVADRLVLVAGAAAGLTLFASALLALPGLPRRTYYGQWTAEFGNMAHYRGRVIAATVGGLPAPSRKLKDSAAARRLLVDGHTVRVRVRAGPPPHGLAPIFSIFDDLQHEMFLVGADGRDLVVHLRMRARDLSLHQPDIRFNGALAGVAAGDTFELAVRWDGASYCYAVNGIGRCRTPDASDGWTYLIAADGFTGSGRSLMDAVWIVLVLLPVGFWLRRTPASLGALALVFSGADAGPAAGWIGTPDAATVGGFAGGLLLGWVLSRIARGAARPQESREA